MTDQQLANRIMDLCLFTVRRYKDPNVGGPGYQQAVRHIEEILTLIATQIDSLGPHVKEGILIFDSLYIKK